MAIVPAAKPICSGFGGALDFHRHCVSPAATAMMTVSVQLNVATEIKRNTNPGEMVPVSPGSVSLRVDANTASARHTPKAVPFADCHCHAAPTRIAAPIAMIVQAYGSASFVFYEAPGALKA